MLHSICQQIWKTQQRPQDWKRSVFIPIPKKGKAKECSKYHTIALISHAREVMFKILQARLRQYVNQQLLYVQTGFRRGRETRDQTANFHCSIIQLCLTFCDPRDYSPSGSSLHRIFQEESWSGLPFPTPTSIGIIEKTREYQKNKKRIYFCSSDYAKVFVDHNKLEYSSRDSIPPYLPPVKPVCRSRSNS